jgi:hypothetical protein
MKELWADPAWREALLKKRADKLASQGGKHSRTRFGVPDGMRKEEAERLWDISRKKAKETMSELEESGALVDTDDAAKEALEAALGVMRSPMKQETCLAAARLVLDFCKAKPAQKTDLTITKAEQWLASVIQDNEQKQNDADTERSGADSAP